MQKRRSHKKSRNGCQNCKKWHTKCDEQGPPCNNCILRKANCVYSRPRAEASNDGNFLPTRPRSSALTKYPNSIERPRGDLGALCAAYGGPTRLLELELMNQWSTHTYKSFCSMQEDVDYLQATLPRSALNYDFMLNCLFAMSSLQIARTVGEANSRKYVHAALEYYNRGSTSFRFHLGNMNAENCDVLYMFSAISIAVHLSIPQQSTSMLDLAAVAFDLVNGSTSISILGLPWLLSSAFPLRIMLSRMGASKDLIDPDARAALDRLNALNDQRHASTPKPIDSIEEEGTILIIHDHELYQAAIQSLELCYAEEAAGQLEGFGSGFPGHTGKKFSSLVGRRDPFALLIVLHWTILLNELNSRFWWLQSIAAPLGQDIADFLRTKHPSLAMEWADAISWALGRLGLLKSRSLELSYNQESEWGQTDRASSQPIMQFSRITFT
ncbi:uncharacterized protein F4812DRAFT_38493 [Daldinia caldariorum]|uniref:uncharacterized protein n=1 Tax=Daldinia caldariorum TaxID=326644 RepID=UPI002008C5FC|nr:uncharacterized protein F4812DRAFT_38493 [Daldinia caldariorum]KAI1473081.1 hypothetical protein F4812DRAFT_38493 [Daldinia caldariorum]